MLRGLFLWMQMLKKKQRHPAYVTSKVDCGNQSTFAAISKNMILLQAFTKFGPHKKQKLYQSWTRVTNVMCEKTDLLDQRWHDFVVHEFFVCIQSFWMQISRRQHGFAACDRSDVISKDIRVLTQK